MTVELQLAGIVPTSVVDGPGIRLVIFVQGCPHNCTGCHNPDTHDPHGGSRVNVDHLMQQVAQSKLLGGVTLSGGEPFAQAEALAILGKQLKQQRLHLMTYTGYTWEELWAGIDRYPGWRQLLELNDLLVEGRYQQELRDLSLPFRGSRNQRLIDVPRSLASGQVVEFSIAAWPTLGKAKFRNQE